MQVSFTRQIDNFKPIIKPLLPDFGEQFCYTIMQWCRLIEEDDDRYWRIWLIMDNDYNTIGICGLYSLNQTNEELWLGWLGVLPELRNKGIGKEIMKFLYDKAKLYDCKTLWSYVDESGAPLNFYKREGFEIYGRVSDYLNNYEIDKKVAEEEFGDPNDYIIRKVL